MEPGRERTIGGRDADVTETVIDVVEAITRGSRGER